MFRTHDDKSSRFWRSLTQSRGGRYGLPLFTRYIFARLGREDSNGTPFFNEDHAPADHLLRVLFVVPAPEV
jgi:hypothetical protein